MHTELLSLLLNLAIVSAGLILIVSGPRGLRAVVKILLSAMFAPFLWLLRIVIGVAILALILYLATGRLIDGCQRSVAPDFPPRESVVDRPVPVPKNLSVYDVTGTGFSLAWDPIDGVDAYHVFMDGSITGRVSAPSYRFGGLESGTTYTLQVAAMSGGREGEKSDPARAVTVTTEAAEPFELTVRPEKLVYRPGETARYAGQLLDANGNPATGKQIALEDALNRACDVIGLTDARGGFSYELRIPGSFRGPFVQIFYGGESPAYCVVAVAESGPNDLMSDFPMTLGVSSDPSVFNPAGLFKQGTSFPQSTPQQAEKLAFDIAGALTDAVGDFISNPVNDIMLVTSIGCMAGAWSGVGTIACSTFYSPLLKSGVKSVATAIAGRLIDASTMSSQEKSASKNLVSTGKCAVALFQLDPSSSLAGWSRFGATQTCVRALWKTGKDKAGRDTLMIVGTMDTGATMGLAMANVAGLSRIQPRQRVMFDYPVGDFIQGRRRGTGGWVRGVRSTQGWHVARDFAETVTARDGLTVRHLGEDWNLGSGKDDALQGVYAIADGTVIRSNADPNYGHVVMIRHPLETGASPGYVVSLYGHLSSRQVIPPGRPVKRGDRVGLIGDEGDNGFYTDATGEKVYWPVHLHFELRLPNNRFKDDDVDILDPLADRSRVGYSSDTTGFVNPTNATSLGRPHSTDGWIDDHSGAEIR